MSPATRGSAAGAATPPRSGGAGPGRIPHPRTGRPPKPPTPAEQHEEWLRLLRPDGPFLALPVLTEAFPQGLDTVPDGVRERLRQGWAEVQEDPEVLGRAWEKLVLGELLGWSPGLREGAALPESLRGGNGVPTPDAVLVGRSHRAGEGPRPRVLFFRTGWGLSLARSRGSEVSLADQAAGLARRHGIPLALLSNGREWALVHARAKEATTVAVFDADLWQEEPLLLRAFATLLHARRVALPPVDAQGQHTTSLAALFARTAEQQRRCHRHARPPGTRRGGPAGGRAVPPRPGVAGPPARGCRRQAGVRERAGRHDAAGLPAVRGGTAAAPRGGLAVRGLLRGHPAACRAPDRAGPVRRGAG
ncbi:hypothetical protein ACWV95_22705 [Streptomyces albus]